jgi:hypothetical protein
MIGSRSPWVISKTLQLSHDFRPCTRHVMMGLLGSSAHMKSAHELSDTSLLHYTKPSNFQKANDTPLCLCLASNFQIHDDY